MQGGAPIFVEHRVDGLSALDASSGAVLWRRRGGIPTARVVLPGALVAGFDGLPMCGLSPSTGETLWRRKGTVHSLARAGDRAIVAGDDLACVTARGRTMWKVQGTLDGENADVRVIGDLAILASDGVKAYRTRDGRRTWKAAPGPKRETDWEDRRWTGLCEACLVERDGVLYGCGWSAAFALDLADGRTRFHRRLAGEYAQMAAPVLVGDTMLCGRVHRGGGFVEALDAADGTSRWRLELPWCEGGKMRAIGSTLIVPTYEEIVGIDVARGAAVWRKPWKAVFWRGEVIGDRLLFSGGGLHLLDPRDGSLVWSVPEPYHGGSMFALVREGTVFAPAGSAVIARRVEDGAMLWRTEVPEVVDDFLLRVFA